MLWGGGDDGGGVGADGVVGDTVRERESLAGEHCQVLICVLIDSVRACACMCEREC